jgi:hypothetical protein
VDCRRKVRFLLGQGLLYDGGRRSGIVVRKHDRVESEDNDKGFM